MRVHLLTTAAVHDGYVVAEMEGCLRRTNDVKLVKRTRQGARWTSNNTNEDLIPRDVGCSSRSDKKVIDQKSMALTESLEEVDVEEAEKKRTQI